MLRLSPTFALIIVNISFYIYTSLIGNSFLYTSRPVLAVYGQSVYAVIELRWWWQLITSMFVHVHLAHLASNMFFLLIFGLRAEELFTDTEYYLIYFVSGLAGNFLSLIYVFYQYPVISAGASGAIFGIFGAVIVYMRKVVERSILGALLFALMFFLITLSADTNIYAHFGGLMVGVILGYLLARKRRFQFIYTTGY